MLDEPLYDVIIGHIFVEYYRDGTTEFEFNRNELGAAAQALGLDDAKNFGDLIYSFRYRRPLPERIRATAARGMSGSSNQRAGRSIVFGSRESAASCRVRT